MAKLTSPIASYVMTINKPTEKSLQDNEKLLQLIPSKQGYERVFKNLQQISWSTWGAKRAV